MFVLKESAAQMKFGPLRPEVSKAKTVETAVVTILLTIGFEATAALKGVEGTQ